MPLAALDRLLTATDPWVEIEQLSEHWTGELARDCETRYASANAEGRKRLIGLLGSTKAKSAYDLLLQLLPRANNGEAAQILRALNGASIVVPTEQIVRRFAESAQEAAVAAGISGDATLAPKLVELLDARGVGRHAALALAMLGRRDFAADIASRIGEVEALDATGFIVALEVMNEPSVVPRLLEHMANGGVASKWDLHHALWRLTGREPLVPFARDREDAARAYSDAWASFDLTSARRPRIERLELDEGSRSASFDLVDAAGSLRIDHDPPVPGSSWPRWEKSLVAGPHRLYDVGSNCGTCETTLRLVGMAPTAAATEAEGIRLAVANIQGLDATLFEALESYVATMRTGHYLAQLVDLPLERVGSPERSWFIRRKERRRHEDADEATEIAWPGTEHFQVRSAAMGELPTYGVVLPMAPLSKLDGDTIDRYVCAISSGARPTALVMTWVERKDICGEFTESFVVGVVLDGHHKLAAYTQLGRPARILALCRLEDSWGPPEDRARWLRDGLRALGEISD